MTSDSVLVCAIATVMVISTVAALNHDALCNNGTQYACVCYQKDGSLKDHYADCRALITEESVSVVELEVVEDFNPLDRFSTTGTDIEPYFKKQLAWLVSSYCETLVNNCKGVGLAINKESVIILKVSCSPSNRTLIQFVITKSRFTKTGGVTNATVMDSQLVSQILMLRVRKLEESTGIWHVFDVRPETIEILRPHVKPKQKSQNMGIVIALIIIGIGLAICYFIASVKVIKDHLARKKAERTREARAATETSYGAMDKTKPLTAPTNSTRPTVSVPRPVDINIEEAPSNGQLNHVPMPVSPVSRASSILEVDVGYMTAEPDVEQPQPDIPSVEELIINRRSAPPVPRRNNSPPVSVIVEESSSYRRSSHSSNSSRRSITSSSRENSVICQPQADIVSTSAVIENVAETPETPPSSTYDFTERDLPDATQIPTPPSPTVSLECGEQHKLHDTYLILPSQLEAAVRRAVSSQDLSNDPREANSNDSNPSWIPQSTDATNLHPTKDERGRSVTISDIPSTAKETCVDEVQSSSSGSDTEDENGLTAPGDYEVLAGSSENLLEQPFTTAGEQKTPVDNPAFDGFIDEEDTVVPPIPQHPKVTVDKPSVNGKVRPPRHSTLDDDVASSSGSETSSTGDTMEELRSEGGSLTTTEYIRLKESQTSLNKLEDESGAHPETISEYDLRDITSMNNMKQSFDRASSSDVDLK